MPDMDAIELAVDARVASERLGSGCYCANYRKPCQYHDGMAYGAEVATQVIKLAALADVSDWLAGA